MAKKKVQEEEVNEELLENQEIEESGLISESFFEKNKNILFGGSIAIIVAFAAYFMIQDSKESSEQEAQIALFPVQQAFEKDSLNLVINGNGLNNKGAAYIVAEYSGTKAANLANFYLGVAQLKQGKFAEAITSLSNFSSDDLLVQAKAYALLGDANLELSKTDEAINFYKKASNYKPNKEFTPVYLHKLAIAYEIKGDKEGAISTYETIVSKYPTSSLANAAKSTLAKIKTKG